MAGYYACGAFIYFDFSMYILYKGLFKATKAGLSGMEKLGQYED